MKSLNHWFEEYSESHQNPVNKAIHYICVPVIYFSIIGLFVSIPNGILKDLFNINNPIIENWAFVILIPIMIFYIRLSLTLSIKMLIFSAICLSLNNLISQKMSLFLFSISVFTIAWVGQFYGHNLEGKKPSFLKDIQFLLIGPAWVADKLFSR
jgi:uncharacterized membrane protein YGL010W